MPSWTMRKQYQINERDITRINEQERQNIQRALPLTYPRFILAFLETSNLRSKVAPYNKISQIPIIMQRTEDPRYETLDPDTTAGMICGRKRYIALVNYTFHYFRENQVFICGRFNPFHEITSGTTAGRIRSNMSDATLLGITVFSGSTGGMLASVNTYLRYMNGEYLIDLLTPENNILAIGKDGRSYEVLSCSDSDHKTLVRDLVTSEIKKITASEIRGMEYEGYRVSLNTY